MKEISISMNQIDTVTGDLVGNFKKIKERTLAALGSGSHIVVFPETAFSGYCVGALWDNVDFINEQTSYVNELVQMVPHDRCVIVGYVRFVKVKKDGFPLLKNSVAIINGGELRHYDKQLLANADHHEDRKYFKPGDRTQVFNINVGRQRITIGTPICEDFWYTDHDRNIPEEMVGMGAQMLITVNQSYFYYGKQSLRDKMYSSTSYKYHVPIISVNSVGVGDIVKNIIIYDGSSLAYSANGSNYLEMKRFEEDVAEVRLRKTDTFGFVGLDVSGTFKKQYEKPDKFTEIMDAIAFEQRELFKLLNIPRAQVHISGGIDSAVVMALSILSMGKKNCVFITNPTSLNSDSLPMVHKLAENFKVDIITDDLEEIYQVFNENDKRCFGSESNKTGQATMQAVLRSVQGLAACHRFNSGIVACGNHTEIVLGWSSFHDIGSIGVHSPVGDLTKLELYEFCECINDRFMNLGYVDHVIPEELYNGKITPAAELPDSKYDPIDYYIQSGLCAEVIRNRKSKNQLLKDFSDKKLTPDFFPTDVYEKYTIDQFSKEVDFTMRKSRISVFKAAQGAPIVILSPRSRGFSNRETIINKYI